MDQKQVEEMIAQIRKDIPDWDGEDIGIINSTYVRAGEYDCSVRVKAIALAISETIKGWEDEYRALLFAELRLAYCQQCGEKSNEVNGVHYLLCGCSEGK